MFKTTMTGALALAIVGAAGLAHAEGDPAKGKRVFNQCRACHVVNKEQNRVGPHLLGLIGRDVASVDGYRYSDAMIAWGEGKVWDEATFLSYIEKPQEVVKGTKMVYRGVKKEDQRADLLAYIMSEAPSN